MFQLTNKPGKLGSLFLALALLCVLLIGTAAAEPADVSAYAPLDAAQAEALAGVYECNLEMGEGMGLMLYLNIDETGNFTFSRSTDFSAPDKGAGVVRAADGEYAMIYSVVNGEEVEEGANVATFVAEDGALQFTSRFWFGSTAPAITAEDGSETYLRFLPSAPVEEQPDIVSGDYAVDTSWSPLAAAHAPVLTVDAEAMTFSLADVNRAEAGPITGAIEYAAGTYTFAAAPDKAITGTYDAETGALALTATTTARPDAEAENLYHVDLSGALLTEADDLVLALDEAANTYRLYEAADPDTVLESGALTQDGDALALTPDGVTPKAGVGTTATQAEDGALTLTSACTAAIPVGEGAVTDDIKFGTYGGTYTYQPGGMPMAIDYYYTLDLDKDGGYRFKSYYMVDGTRYDGYDERGTYSASNGTLTLKSGDGKLMHGAIDTNGHASLHRSIGPGMSGGQGSAFDISLTHGYTPAPGQSAAGIAYGTYGGTHSVPAMGGTVDYAVSLTLNENGTYNYRVSFVVGGQTYSESESGTYTVNGETLRLTSSDGKVMVGRVSPNGTASITRLLSSFATSAATVNLRLGYNPAPGGTANPGGKTDPETDPEKQDEEESFKTGPYGGEYSYQPSGMPMAIEYAYTLDLKKDGTYTFESTYNVSGTDYPGLSETGTYAVKDGALTLTESDGSVYTGTIDANGHAKLSRPLSNSMSGGKGAPRDIDLTLGYVPGGQEEPEPQPSDEPDLTSGAYYVDISWSPMGAMMTPVLDIDAEKMTFKVYNATAPDASKGEGTISYENGVYTLTYDNGNTTTFTYADDVITFSSKLFYGAASFNSAGEDGKFVPYTATKQAPQQDEEPEYKTGLYGGKITNVSRSGKETDYVYTLTLNEDNTYTYTASFAMGGEVYTQTENGTYTVEDGALTLVSDGLSVKDANGEEAIASSASETMTGTIDADGNATVERYVSYFAAMGGDPAELTLTYGVTYELEVEEPETYKTGLYGGRITNVSRSGRETDYVYTLTLNEDGTYAYTASFVTGGEIYTQTESGVYVVDSGALILTSQAQTVKDASGEEVLPGAGGDTMTGTIDSEGNATVERHVSLFARMGGDPATLTFTYGKTYELEVEEPEPAFKTGVYGGDYSYKPNGMPLPIEYVYTLDLNDDDTYSFKSSFKTFGTIYDGLDETGAYKVEDGAPTLTESDGTQYTGTIDADGNAALNRPLSAGRGSGKGTYHDIELKYGYAPTLEPDEEEEPDDGKTDDLETGKYVLSESSYAEAATHKMNIIIAIDAEARTLHTYSMAGDEKGTGTYTFDAEAGVYTVTYTADTQAGAGKTATFTHKDGVITFTSPLYYGVARLYEVDENDEFMTYDAVRDDSVQFEGGEQEEEKPDTTGKLQGSARVKNTTEMMWNEYGLTVAVGVDADDRITDIAVVDFADKAEGMNFYTSFANLVLDGNDDSAGLRSQLTGKSAAELANMEIDAVTGATCTSRGVFNAVKDAFGLSSDTADEPETDRPDLAGGAYYVDVSWSPMGAMMTPVLDVDAENMTFKVYNATAPESSKGAGTITYENGVYTLTYDNGNITTFTYADGVITFTSKLFYGAASFNSAGDDGKFVPYTATKNAPKTEEEEEEPAYKTGLYGGKYTSVSKSGRTTDYVYTLTLNEDGTYAYTASFSMGGDVYTQTESGSCTVEGGTLTLVSDGLTVKDGSGEAVTSSSTRETMTGAIDADGNATVERYVSYFAAMSGAKTALDFTYGKTYALATEEPEEPEETYKTGVYGGTYAYTPSGMPMTIDYAYTLDLRDDGSYAFRSSYKAGGSVYDGLDETGAYTAKDGALTLTESDGATYSGTIAADGSATLNRPLSASMSGSGKGTAHDITLKHGVTPTLTADETESEPEAEAEAYKTGAYGGKHAYQPSGMPMAINYVYTLNLNADDTYAFTSEYAVMGNTSKGIDESGTYAVKDGKLTLTASDGTTFTGTINADGKATLTRTLSKSSGNREIELTHGYTATLSSAPAASVASAPEAAEESVNAESGEEAETEPEQSPDDADTEAKADDEEVTANQAKADEPAEPAPAEGKSTEKAAEEKAEEEQPAERTENVEEAD